MGSNTVSIALWEVNDMPLKDFDIEVIDKLIKRYGGAIHLKSWTRITNKLKKKLNNPCMVGQCSTKAEHIYCDRHFDEVRKIWIKEGE